MLPNFFIGGVSSGGTSFLATALKQHPEIYIPDNIVPEPHFFLKSWEYKRGLEYYEKRWFSRVEKESVIGEKSSSYLFGGEVVAKRIHLHIPDARFIFSLRNPVERTWASYRFTVLNGLEPLDFETALRDEQKRVSGQSGQWAEIQPYNYTGRGYYATQLRSFLEIFPRDNIHIIKFENMIDNPDACLREVFEFLRVDPSFKPDINGEKFSSLEVRDPKLQKELRDRFGDRFSQIIKSIRQGSNPSVHLVNESEEEYLKLFRENLQTGIQEIKPETREFLCEKFKDEINQLREIVDFPLDDWL